MNKKELINWLKVLLLMIAVVGIGLFAFNQALAWHYKAYLLQKPCQLCLELNPNYQRCLVNISDMNNDSYNSTQLFQLPEYVK